MDKIYLRLRKNVILDDGLWTLVVGDMIVQKNRSKIKRSQTFKKY
jgi:hypothetical protein